MDSHALVKMAVNTDLFSEWNGQIVPRTFNAGLVVLSYCVSFIGSLCTLELINRRTSPKGLSNHLLLFSAAVTMGGISIWSMHYVGNRAIQLLNGENYLQIAYSSGFTALSFFVPVIVLLPAFVAAGSNTAVSWWRVTIGGSLAGAAVCGMHYLGNNSISNYSCIYSLPHVIGSVVIAIVASNIALATFFMYRAAWTQAWWKRVISALLLAGGVSGMHWVASTGTQYRLVHLKQTSNAMSRNVTAIMVICLSVGACLFIAASSIYTARMVRRYATKAKQVTLAAGLFDKHGRVLVTREGLLPIETITDSFPERTSSDSLTEAHPLFHWMFQASRNWGVIAPLVRNTATHLSLLPSYSYDTIDGEIKLVNSHGEAIEKYDVVFKEMFSVAAAALAERLKTPMTSLGVLWDHIIPTGISHNSRGQASDYEKADVRRSYGHGSLMFLVRSIDNERDAADFQAAGYRFAEPHQVSSIIASSLRLKPSDVESGLHDMARYGREPRELVPGVHLGFFGVRARVSSQGFEVLVRSTTRNMLPSVMLPLERLDSEQLDFLARFDRTSTTAMLRMLQNVTGNKLTARQNAFSNMLVDALTSLRGQLEPGVFDQAMLICKPIELPCMSASPGSSHGSRPSVVSDSKMDGGESAAPIPMQMCQMICLRTVIPIHQPAVTPSVNFIPLNFFKLHQLMFTGSAYHLAFSRGVHRDIAPVVNSTEVAVALHKPNGDVRCPKARAKRFLKRTLKGGTVDGDGNPVPTTLYRTKTSDGTSNRSSSTLKLWPGRHSTDQGDMTMNGAEPGDRHVGNSAAGFGGIMVSQEVTVQVGTEPSGDDKNATTVVHSANGLHSVAGIPLIGEASSPALLEALGGGIELKNMQHSVGHMGSKVISSRGDKLGDVRTYVDDLFAICIGER
ncbi:Signaling protein YkoW [Ceratocystis lukuohia]|uniref:Signaling protein YkoW n=1 Tax=Ceratocystis lukuohia TaxID=2019550 RepID=A0ABR4MR90_9PEZI